MKISYDITCTLSQETAQWPGHTPFELHWTRRMDEGEAVNLSRFSLSPHTGTHVDAPYHFHDSGPRIVDLPLEIFVGDCAVISVAGWLRDQEELIIREKMVQEAFAGRPVRPRVLVHTGYRPGVPFKERFASFAPAVVRWLAERGVKLLGTDAPSVDAFASKELPAHRTCGKCGVIIMENLSLNGVEEGIYRLVALPLKIAEAEATPVRAVLLAESD